MPEFPALLILDVTQDHINRGKGGDPEACAISLALKEATGADNAEVTGSTGINVYTLDDETGSETEAIYVGPRAISKFIERFDAMRGDGEGSRFRTDVKPTTFRLKRQTLYRDGKPV